MGGCSSVAKCVSAPADLEPRTSGRVTTSEGEARARCALLSAEALTSYLKDIGMDIGLDSMDRDELTDLAAAGFLSAGCPLPTLAPETERREEEEDALSSREGNAASASREDSPSSPPSSSGRAPSSLADVFRAARMGRADALEAMLRDGAVHADAVDASSEHGFSLLMVAAMNGAKGACKRLLSLGANASAEDARGRTALDLALEYGHDAVADLLARRGATFGRRSRRRAENEAREDGGGGVGARCFDASPPPEPSAPPAPARFDVRSVSEPTAGGLVAALVPASETRSAESDDERSPRREGSLLRPE